MEEVLKRNTELEQEVRELRKQMFNLLNGIKMRKIERIFVHCTASPLSCGVYRRDAGLKAAGHG